jgi:Cytochrome C biogenesis protein
MTKGITQAANTFIAGLNRVALTFMSAPRCTTRQDTASAHSKVRRAVPHSRAFASFFRRWGLQPLRLPKDSRASAPEANNFIVKRIAFLLLLLAFASAPLVTAQVGYSPRAKEIGMHLKCLCRGCDMSAGGCAHPGGSFSGPCDTAKGMLKEIDQHLAKGESEQQIIDAFVAQYGTIVYVEPPKKGFGLVAWLMPVFYAVVGLALLVFVVRKWALKPSAETATVGQAPATHNDAFDRARAQAARETED